MKIGVVGLMPEDPTDLSRERARAIREAGFAGVGVVWRFPVSPPIDRLRSLNNTLTEAGLEAAQFNTSYPDLVSEDEARRAAGVHRLVDSCRWARAVGADNTYVRPGSMNAAGPWTPHPANRAPRTFDRLISSLRAAAKEAANEGVLLAIEGHVLSPLYSFDRTRDLVEAVGSPWLKFNADPANFVGSVEDAYGGPAIINQMFDALGDSIHCAHVKDIRVANPLVLHIDECIPGDGILDLDTFCRRFEACRPSGFALIEHLADSDIPRARDGLVAAARRSGTPFEPDATS